VVRPDFAQCACDREEERVGGVMMVWQFGCGSCLFTSCLLVIDDGDMALCVDMNENSVSVCTTGLRRTV